MNTPDTKYKSLKEKFRQSFVQGYMPTERKMQECVDVWQFIEEEVIPAAYSAGVTDFAAGMNWDFDGVDLRPIVRKFLTGKEPKPEEKL